MHSIGVLGVKERRDGLHDLMGSNQQYGRCSTSAAIESLGLHS